MVCFRNRVSDAPLSTRRSCRRQCLHSRRHHQLENAVWDASRLWFSVCNTDGI